MYQQLYIPILWVVFLFCWWFPLLCKIFLVWCCLICLFFLLFPLPGEIYPIKYCFKQCLRFFCLCFLLWFLWLLSLTFRPLIHFEFILMCGIWRWSGFIFLHISVQFYKHHLLTKLSLAHCMCLLPLSNINWLYRCGFISGPSILFHWSLILFLWNSQAVLITVALSYSLIFLLLCSSLRIAVAMRDICSST